MSDVPRGPGSWRAADGLWYGPDQRPPARPDPRPTGAAGALPTLRPTSRPPAAPVPPPSHWGEGAEFRPVERPPRVPFRRRIRVGLVVAFALLIAAAVGMARLIIDLDVESANRNSPSTAAATTTAADPAATTRTVFGDGSSPDRPVALGEPGDTGDDWAVKVTAVNLLGNEAVRVADPKNDPPPPGTRYVIVSLDASYLGAASGNPFGRTLAVLGSDGVERVRWTALASPPGVAFADGAKVSTGGSISGDAVFVVGESESGLRLRVMSADGRNTWFALA